MRWCKQWSKMLCSEERKTEEIIIIMIVLSLWEANRCDLARIRRYMSSKLMAFFFYFRVLSSSFLVCRSGGRTELFSSHNASSSVHFIRWTCAQVSLIGVRACICVFIEQHLITTIVSLISWSFASASMSIGAMRDFSSSLSISFRHYYLQTLKRIAFIHVAFLVFTFFFGFNLFSTKWICDSAREAHASSVECWAARCNYKLLCTVIFCQLMSIYVGWCSLCCCFLLLLLFVFAIAIVHRAQLGESQMKRRVIKGVENCWSIIWCVFLSRQFLCLRLLLLILLHLFT